MKTGQKVLCKNLEATPPVYGNITFYSELVSVSVERMARGERRAPELALGGDFIWGWLVRPARHAGAWALRRGKSQRKDRRRCAPFSARQPAYWILYSLDFWRGRKATRNQI